MKIIREHNGNDDGDNHDEEEKKGETRENIVKSDFFFSQVNEMMYSKLFFVSRN